MKKRVVALFTGSRAEYDLQFTILRAIDRHPSLDYRLLVAGAHLDPNFGYTLNEIRNDGFHLDAEIEIEMDTKSHFSTAQAIGSGVLKISKVLDEMRPDIVVVYGDRFEAFAAAIAATQMNIPTAHIEGGDLTEGGALDDSVRHAITKLAHLHLTTNEQASNRILGMGEEAWRVHTVGLPSNDLISEGKFATKSDITKKLGLDLCRPIVLFTQHSVSTEFEKAAEQVEPSIHAIKRLADEGVQTVLTFPNNDAGGKVIIQKLEAFGVLNYKNTQVKPSLGRFIYLGILALARDPEKRVVCLGNSSSGLKETSTFGCPAINIGSRQDGRLRGENVIDVEYSSDAIYTEVKRALFDDDFRALCREAKNPYWSGEVGPKVSEILAKLPLDKSLIRKRMTLKGDISNGWHR